MNSNKVIFLGLFLGLIFTTLSYICLTYINLGCHCYVEEQEVNEVLRIKSANLEQKFKFHKKFSIISNINHPNNLRYFILLSGSNSWYGFLAEQLTQVYHLNTMNLGTDAGLGLNYILYYGKNSMPQATFILPLEYELYGKPSYSLAYIQRAISSDIQYFKQLSTINKIKSILYIPLSSNRKAFINHIDMQFHPAPLIKYNLWTNDYGDKISRQGNNMPKNYKSNIIPKKFTHSEEAWNDIEEFNKYIKLNGGKVIITYPNVYKRYLDSTLNAEFLQEIKLRANHLGIQVIGNPEERKFGDDRIYDTVYHQTSDGQRISTSSLVNDLHQAGY